MILKEIELLNKSIDIAKSYGFDITYELVIKKYGNHNRYWHTPDHLLDILDGIEQLFEDNKINHREYNILIIAAIFHDIIYNTRRHDNEERSVEFMMSKFNKNLINPEITVSDWRLEEDIIKITDVIIGTKTHDSHDGLLKKFNNLDTWILDAQLVDMLDWEDKIRKEYRWVSWKKYKKGRIDFLISSIKEHSRNAINIKNLIDFINKKIPKTGLFYYEIDKFPTIEQFNLNNRKLIRLFDSVEILLIYSKENYDKELIKEYVLSSEDTTYVLNKDEVFDFILRKTKSDDSDYIIIKELKYVDDYDKQIKYLNGLVKFIYI